MDPNEALEAIRNYHDSIRKKLPQREFDNNTEGLVEQAIETFEGLDTWLTKGGFLPDAWQRP